MAVDEDGDGFSDHLFIRASNTGTGKIKNSKKQYWVTLDKQRSQLHCFKNSKDTTILPLEILNLYGAGVSYGNTDENEFIIDIRGCEYRLNAESHKSMMKWTRSLKKQITIKPSIVDESTQPKPLAAVPEDEILELKSDNTPKVKRRNFFTRLFSRLSFRLRSKTDSPHGSVSGSKHIVKAAPLRSVVGSMQDISNKPQTCNNCLSYESHNAYLTEQVRKLNEDVENLKDQLRTYIKKSDTLVEKNMKVKSDFVSFVQKTAAQDNCEYESFKDIPYSGTIIELVKEHINNNAFDESLQLNSDDEPELYADYLGFYHGDKCNAMETALHLCEELKRRYFTCLQDEDLVYKKWQLFSADLRLKTGDIEEPMLHELIQHGIPHEFRPQMWKMMVECHVSRIKMEKGDHYYSKLVNSLTGLQNEETCDDDLIEKQIKIDLLRSMPDHQDFEILDQPKIWQLHRILRAFLLHNKDVGYCQGMNFMVAFGLLYLDEETSFWLLVAITEVYFNKDHYNLYLSGTQANQKVFDDLCKEELSDLMTHFTKLNCELSPITFNWFMTIFFDAAPVHVVLNIWDCFLLHGEHMLYVFALKLLKLQQNKLLACRDTLSLMRTLKTCAKMFYDSELLLKEVFEENREGLKLKCTELYEKYILEIEEKSKQRQLDDEEYEKQKQKLKFTPKQMMVSVSDNLDELNDDLVIKCAECEENCNYVWMLCTSELLGQIFVLNVASHATSPIAWQVDCKCLYMHKVLQLDMMLVSTMKSTLHAIDTNTKNELWQIQLAGCALSISSDSIGNVSLTLMDGSISIFQVSNEQKNLSQPTYIDISHSPVFAGCMVDKSFWCGAANKIVVLDMKTLETQISMRVCPNEKHAISQLVPTDVGVWCTVISSSVLHLWHKSSHICLLTVDVLFECGLASEKKMIPAADSGISTLMAYRKKLWVGFGNGRFIINDVIESENTVDDLNDIITQFKNSMEDLTKNILNKPPTKLGVSSCCHDIEGEPVVSPTIKQRLLSPNDGFSGKRVSQIEAENRVEVTLKMNQIQRVCENSVGCFVPCRNDKRLVLSCMGALNDDSSVILWNSERHEGREMWFAQTVSYSE